MKADDGEWMVVQGTITAKRLHADGFIAQVPSQGYARDQYSMESISWLEWKVEEHRRIGEPITIQHALNGGEFKVPNTNFKLDGYCKSTRTAYEYHVSMLDV